MEKQNTNKFLQKFQQSHQLNIIKMQRQMWDQYGNYFQLFQYPQYQSVSRYMSPLQIYPVMCDFSGYDFKFVQLQNLPEPSNSEPGADKREIQPISPSEEKPQLENEQIEGDSKDKDRNIVSNSLKVFRKYASDSAKAQRSIVMRIIARNNLNYTVEEFIKDLDKKIPRQRNYFGIKFLKNLLSNKEKKTSFIVVLRTLLSFYYRKEIYPTVLTSWKILSPAKKKQILGTRKIRELLS